MHAIGALPRSRVVGMFALALVAPGAVLAAQQMPPDAPVLDVAGLDTPALVAPPTRAGVSYLPAAHAPRPSIAVASATLDVRAARGSTGRSILRGAAIGALAGAAGGVAMGAFVCNQGFGCSDRGRGIAYWTLAGAGAGAVTGWVLHVVRRED